jgi:hypothetical protein
MSAPTPYALEQAMSVLMAVRSRLLEDDPDLADDERLMADMLEGESDDALEVLHRMVRASLHAKSMAEAAKQRAADMDARAARYARRDAALRGGVFAAMDALQLRKLEQPDFTAGVSAGTVAVVITDETALPDEFMRVEKSPNKTAIGAALKGGATVPGAELSNGLPRLSVRVK